MGSINVQIGASLPLFEQHHLSMQATAPVCPADCIRTYSQLQKIFADFVHAITQFNVLWHQAQIGCENADVSSTQGDIQARFGNQLCDLRADYVRIYRDWISDLSCFSDTCWIKKSALTSERLDANVRRHICYFDECISNVCDS